jgi:hypothetical protein
MKVSYQREQEVLGTQLMGQEGTQDGWSKEDRGSRRSLDREFPVTRVTREYEKGKKGESKAGGFCYKPFNTINYFKQYFDKNLRLSGP